MLHMSKVTQQYRDTASTAKLERSMKMFSLDYESQGSGSTTIGKINSSYERQKSKVKVIDFLFVIVR